MPNAAFRVTFWEENTPAGRAAGAARAGLPARLVAAATCGARALLRQDGATSRGGGREGIARDSRGVTRGEVRGLRGSARPRCEKG